MSKKQSQRRNALEGLSPAQVEAAMAARRLKKDDITFSSVMRHLLRNVGAWIVIAALLWGIVILAT